MGQSEGGMSWKFHSGDVKMMREIFWISLNHFVGKLDVFERTSLRECFDTCESIVNVSCVVILNGVGYSSVIVGTALSTSEIPWNQLFEDSECRRMF